MRQLAVYLFVYNTEKIRYPWRESILSALELTNGRGAVFVCDCESNDGTSDELRRWFSEPIASRRLIISQHPWGTTHTIQVDIANFLLDQIGQDYKWALKLDADEVLHEASFNAFLSDLQIMHATFKVLGRPHYTHLCPDDRTVFPFIYDSKAVLSATHSGQRFHDNDACALGGGGIPEYQTRLEIHHFGKMAMGREREALLKEVEFTRLYTDLGFPDPKVEAQREQGWLDYMRVFDVAFSRGDFQPFHGTHPKFVEMWLDDARRRHKAFIQGGLHAA